jgi:hypothetical protein
MRIYDNRGRIVSWYASVFSTNNTGLLVSINPIMEVESFDVLPPRSPTELLEGETLFVDVYTDTPCHLSIDVRSHSGNYINKTIPHLPVGISQVPIIDVDDSFPHTGDLIGKIGCDDYNFREIDLKWHKVGHRIISKEFYSTVEYNEDSKISLSPEYEGDDSRYYDFEIQGAASRVAEIGNIGAISPNDEIIILINPDGLLVPGMIAKGELVFVDNFGIELRIPITLEAESSFTSNSALSWLSEPGNGLLLVSILMAVSIFTGGIPKQELSNSDKSEE